MKEEFKADTIGTLNFAIEAFIDNHEVYEYSNATIVIELVTLPGGHHWRAVLTPKPAADAMKELLVEEHGLVRHLWYKTDIQDWATSRYRPLTDDELQKVADSLSKTDCEYGISWQTIDDSVTSVIEL